MRSISFIISVVAIILIALCSLGNAARPLVVNTDDSPKQGTPPHKYDVGETDEEDFSGDEGSGDEEYSEDDEDWDEEYEATLLDALKIYSSESHTVLEKALKAGGLTTAVEIQADGSIAGTNIDDELWQAEFALSALRQEMELLTIVGQSTGFFPPDENEGEEEEYDDDDDNNESGHDSWSPDVVQKTQEVLFGEGHDAVIEKFLEDDPELKKMLHGIEDKKYAAQLFLDIKYEADMKARLDPEKWYKYNYWELHAYFGCARVFGGQRLVYDSEKWAGIRDYWNVFKKNDEKKKPLDKKGPRTYQFNEDSFDLSIALDPFQAGEKGRGLKAKQDVKKGELVFKATNNTLIFTHGHTWRMMLFAFYDERGEVDDPVDADTTCDLLVWSWVQTLEEDGPLVVVMDLDNGSLLNEGRDEVGWDPPNVICGQEGDTICFMAYYATKDIKAGDEILCDYREFAYLDSWPEMGL